MTAQDELGGGGGIGFFKKRKQVEIELSNTVFDADNDTQAFFWKKK